MTMIGSHEDDPPQVALRLLSDYTPTIYRIFEAAIHESRAYFEEHGEEIDRYLFPNLVRYHALRLFGRDENKNGDYSIIRLSNNGIKIAHRACLIRIWKADEGELPAAGDSETKLDYYYQPYLPNFFEETGVPPKLAIIWDLDFGFNLNKLILACPKGSENPYQPGEAHWYVEIPHPVAAAEVFTSTNQDVDDLELQPKERDAEADDQR
jgi:hypothetical protein